MNEFNATTDDDQASKLSTDGRSDGSRSRSRSRSRPRNRTMRVLRSREPPSDPFPQRAKWDPNQIYIDHLFCISNLRGRSKECQLVAFGGDGGVLSSFSQHVPAAAHWLK
ncbi:hypothetical protein MRX96_024150 [Rhipicephalus microplus]